MPLVRNALTRSVLTLALLSGSTFALMPAIAQEGPSVDVVEITIADIQAGFASGAFTSEELVQAFLDRIAEYDPYYNAFVSLNPAALDDARAIDARRAAGEELGPLAGVPVAVKDSIDMAGIPTTGAWAILSSMAGGVDLIPERDAPVVAMLRAAGAVIIGKANLDALSWSSTTANASFVGPVFNAVNRDIAPGASSSGTATAVAASFTVVGIGEETGGSIQNPAGAQSVVALKPTFGLIPNIGVQPYNSSLQDVLGPFGRTVTDVAILLDAISGYAAEDPKTVASFGNRPVGGYAANLSDASLEGARIGIYGAGWRERDVSSETMALFNAAVAELEAQGATIVPDPFAGTGFAELRGPEGSGSAGVFVYDWANYLERLGPSAVVNTMEELRALPPAVGLLDSPFLSADGDIFGDDIIRGLVGPDDMEQLANPTLPPDLSGNFAWREQYLAAFRAVMEEQNLDAIVFPQAPVEYPGIFSGETISQTASGMNTANLPGVIVPAGAYASGTPFALIFVGDIWSDGTLLSFAYDYEQATHHRIVPTLVTEPYPNIPDPIVIENEYY